MFGGSTQWASLCVGMLRNYDALTQKGRSMPDEKLACRYGKFAAFQDMTCLWEIPKRVEDAASSGLFEPMGNPSFRIPLAGPGFRRSSFRAPKYEQNVQK